MWRVALRDLRVHLLRTVLTCLAVAIGVALLIGTSVVVSSSRSALGEAWGRAFGGVAVAVEGYPNGSGLLGPGGRAPLPSTLVNRMRAVPGIGAVEGQVQGQIDLQGSSTASSSTDGQPTSSAQQVAVTAMSIGSVPALRPVDLLEGHFPQSASQVVVDQATVAAQGWRIGQTIRAAGDGGVVALRLVGVVGFDTGAGTVTTPFAGLTVARAQSMLDLRGHFSTILATGRPAAVGSPASSSASASDASRRLHALASSTREVVGQRYFALTGPQLVDQAVAQQPNQSAFSPVLGVVVAVALFVGVLVVFNALSMVVAQRRRLLALLRCVGASAGQIGRTIVVESAVIGFLGSLVGIAVGLGVAALLHASEASQQSSTALGPLRVQLWVLVAGLALGIGVSVAAALLPAWRASRTPPVTALRQDVIEQVATTSRDRLLGAFGCGLAGFALIGMGLSGAVGDATTVSLLGVMVVVIGLFLAGPLAVVPLSRAVGWPLVKLQGFAGWLGRRTTMRHGRRTASTVTALVVGVALVSFLAVTASSARASADSELHQTLGADFVVDHVGTSPLSIGPTATVPLAPGVLTALEAQRQLLVSPFSFVSFLDQGRYNWGGEIDQHTFPKVVDLSPVQGDFGDIGHDGIAVSRQLAAGHHFTLGESTQISFFGGSRGLITRTVVIRAIYGHGDYYAGYLLPQSALRSLALSVPLTAVFVSPRAGVSLAAAHAALDRALVRYPDTVVQTPTQATAQQNQTINGQIDVLALLLVLAVAVAIVGIVNTLALSVFERTRELAMLKVLGLSPRQLRQAIRTEAVTIAVIGSVTGVLVGILLGWVLQKLLVNQGLTTLSMPWTSLVAIVALGALTGVLAAAVPAQRAAKVDMLAALTEE